MTIISVVNFVLIVVASIGTAVALVRAIRFADWLELVVAFATALVGLSFVMYWYHIPFANLPMVFAIAAFLFVGHKHRWKQERGAIEADTDQQASRDHDVHLP